MRSQPSAVMVFCVSSSRFQYPAKHCYARVTRYKVPRKIVAVDDLPRSMLGKILRRKVREQLLNSEEFSH